MKPLAKSVTGVTASGIRRFFDLAAQVEGLLSLGVGEPRYPAPASAKQAAIEAIQSDVDGYTSNFGRITLRQGIADNLRRRYGVGYDPANQVLVTTGVSEGIDLAIRAVLEPGDEVIFFEPTYVSYGPVVTFSGGKAIAIPTRPENAFAPDPDTVRATITSRTKAIILGFPCNPTGAVPPREVFEEIVQIAIQNDLWIISDEIYDCLVFEGEHTCLASLPGAYERTILLGGFSKNFAMTGWRIGYACATPDVIEVMMKIHQYTALCAPTISQVGCEGALREAETYVPEMIRAMDAKRRYFVGQMREAGLNCQMPQGSFFAFCDISASGLDSETYTERLLKEQKVLVVPGTAFTGWSGDETTGRTHVRCCYAIPDEDLQEACRRIKTFLSSR
ncbi:pyridoxal phosphate-dependent aminotransferase [Fimbriimonas ginsengisoli]|uniref:Aminotransferase n=1 Tax=Fimbriimonas ginsengisoli Gsoil 348 TaxID=661478 RepID=A0A068NJJ2_FIMGI|nr:aminotransferase class I/II-fold pyridoxal phosphate-dependent enzyme [Fimbriimonas ginsengisoli]AIE83612.1 aminotransferase class I and II [Fimbriimonas ginsengisoli Gsoil 348]